ncbi:helicase-associated domain-containing protein [Leucobacter sp. CSA2]|uniref:Helicase-associated domain-containing protein n=1 Tax=Leucobacter edaphi TaxID=2796472 RepID=A0A934UWP5_9MICO|nr:helicase-associated domain-containing protein [Leucobacter edaphi]MBK0420483.1 helicase-associated domain-containing protein [Leucobacter edaphi]
MSGTLALASALARMDRDELSRLVHARRPHAPAAVLDPIGLASELLRPDSISRAVSLLSIVQLGALDELDAGREPDRDTIAGLLSLGLVGEDAGAAAPLPEVSAAIAQAFEAIAQRSPLDEDGDPALEAAEASAGDDLPAATNSLSEPEIGAAAWIDTALTAVGRCAECLRQLRDRPLRLNRTGVVSYSAAKWVSERIGIPVDSVQRAFAALGLAGLTTPAASEPLLLTTAESADWLEADIAERWIALAQGALGTLSGPLRAVLETHDGDLGGALSELPTAYPLLPEADLTAAANSVELAEALGLTLRGRLSEPGRLLLEGHRDEAARAAEAAIPARAQGIYLQPDLSVIVPGPLAPADEEALSALSRPEHIGIASTRRVTEAAVTEALEAGRTGEEVLQLFASLSLTGVPQPLTYLVTSLAERVGSIVVSEHDGDDGRSRISVSRPELAETLLVDRALQHLQLRRGDRDASVLFSRLRPDHVIAALSDARYLASAPGIRLDIPGSRGGDPGADAQDPSPAAVRRAEDESALAELVERVFEAARSEPGTGDFTRRIELAIRERRAVRVTAEAAGQSRSFTLLPVSLSGGRLRASDQTAGVERTLPVNLITAVEPV